MGVLEIIHQFLAAIGGTHMQSARHKLIPGLLHQAEAVDDEIELGDRVFLSEEIGQALHRIIGQSRLAAALRVPDDARLHALVQFPADGQRSEKLLIAHHVLFEFHHRLAAIQFRFLLNVGKAVMQHEEKAFPTQQ